MGMLEGGVTGTLLISGPNVGRGGVGTTLWRRRNLLAVPVIMSGSASLAQGRLPRDIGDARPAFPLMPGFPQRMTARGNGIHAANGNRMVLRGLCIPDVAWIAQRNDRQMGYFDARLFTAAAAWGSDILRLSIMPAVWRRLGEAAVMRTLDTAVAYARHVGMYVSICWHGIGFPPTDRYMTLRDVAYGPLFDTTTPEMRRFWQIVASHFAGDDVVAWFELFNEPQFINEDGRPAPRHTTAMWLAFRDWAESMVDGIRAVAPSKPVVVGGLQFAYDLSFAAHDPLRRPNIAYATHPYPTANWSVPWGAAFLEPAQRLPVMATEFGWDERDHPERALRGARAPYRQEIIAAFERVQMCWQAWCFSHIFTPALLASADFTTAGDYGEFVQAELLRRKRAGLGLPTAG
jgi:hypothetical protein